MKCSLTVSDICLPVKNDKAGQAHPKWISYTKIENFPHLFCYRLHKTVILWENKNRGQTKMALSYYGFDSTTGVWAHVDAGILPLNNLTEPGQELSRKSTSYSLVKLMQLANQYASVKPKICSKLGCCILDTTPEHLRWFSLPD
ncbi:MAG: hypothetical protein L3J24_02145 [Xanthomonadales bacterium]|nr:hypothetical protein [Xanthomonadales bacterium]